MLALHWVSTVKHKIWNASAQHRFESQIAATEAKYAQMIQETSSGFRDAQDAAAQQRVRELQLSGIRRVLR